MKRLKYLTVFKLILFVFCLLMPEFVSGEPREGVENTIPPGSINIKSRTLELDNKLKLITFSGDVIVTKDDFIIHCDKLVGYGLDVADQKEKEEDSTRFEKIIATGNVIIDRVEGGNATSEQAVYYQDKDEIVLTGNPVVTKDKDIVKGEKITIFLKEDRVLVDDPIGTFAPRKEKE